MNELNETNSGDIVNQAKLMGAVDRILIKKSIAMRCSDFQPMRGPLGIVSGAEYNRTTNKLKIVKKEVIPESETIRTEFTQEALEDLFALYGEDIHEMLAYYLVDELMYRIDSKFITMIKNRAKSNSPLVFNGPEYDSNLLSVGQAIAINITKGLLELPVSDSRSSKNFAIVSPNVAAVLHMTTQLADNTPSSENKNDDSPSYMGCLAGTDYYIDNTHNNSSIDAVLYGIKGNGFSKGSTIFSPYTRTWITSNDPDNGEKIFFMIDRTGMTVNPLDDSFFLNGTGTSAFLGKFDVDLSDLELFN